MKLFIDEKALKFEKVAYKDLEDPETWPDEVRRMLLTDYPFLGNHGVEIVFKDIKPEEGFAFGFALVVSDTGKEIKVPIIIRGNKLYNMDVFLKDKILQPLTQARAEEALFSPLPDAGMVRPEDVILSTQNPMAENLYPPNRLFGGFGYTVKSSALLGDAKRGSLLENIKATMLPEHLSKIASMLKDDDVLFKLAMNNKAIMGALKIFADSEKMQKTAGVSIPEPDPTVIQITGLENNTYQVKTANFTAFHIKKEILGRGSVLSKYGAEAVRVADTKGTITSATHTSAEGPNTDLEPVTSSGMYKVMTVAGDIMMGMVIPDVFDLNANKISTKLFLSGDKYGMQADIRGQRMGDIDIPRQDGIPKGMGVFIWDKNFDQGHNRYRDDIYASIPVIVDSAEKTMDGGEERDRIVAADLTGEPRIIVKAPVKTMIKAGDITMIPTHASFIPVGEAIPLADNFQAEKIAEGKNFNKSVTIKFAGDRFSFSGPPVEGIPDMDKTALDWNDASFFGCSLGMYPEFAESKLKQAVRYGKTTVKVAHQLTPFKVYATKVLTKTANHRSLMKKLAEAMNVLLLKEATVIADEDTVDEILSLGFINEDNIQRFIEYIPDLERAQRKLCELLLASRIGLQELDEGALKVTVRSLEKAIEGLKRIAFTSTVEQ